MAIHWSHEKRSESMRISPGGVIILLVLGACSRGPTPDMPENIHLPGDLVGCYELWHAKNLYYAPPRLRLDAHTLTGRNRGFVKDSTATAWMLTRLDADGRPMDEHDHDVLYWQTDRTSNRLRVMISSGHSGTELSLGTSASTDTLRGRATEHWDFGPPFSNSGGAVSLARIPCDTDSAS